MMTRTAKSAIGNRQTTLSAVGGRQSAGPNTRRPLPTAHCRLPTRSGFTLIELLAVLVILAVLAALVVPRFAGRGQQARETAARTDISTLRTALAVFESDNDRYPTTQEGLGALLDAPAGLNNWRGPYLDQTSLPRDPWGNPYVYRQPGERNPRSYDLFSPGPDGRPGTDDDIGNWD
jgi:general secretion pathway protein G